MPSRAARMRLPSLLAIMPSLSCHFQAHRTGGALDHGHGRLNAVAVQIGHLLLGDLADLGAGDAASLVALARRGRTLLNVRCLLEEERHGWLLHFESEGAVLIRGDDHRDR